MKLQAGNARIGALENWSEWSRRGFQLKARKDRDADTVWLRVFFEIEVGGDTDSGEDEFEIVRDDGGWRIKSIPS